MAVAITRVQFSQRYLLLRFVAINSRCFVYNLSLGLPFTVNETTGEIKTTGKLDRETNSSFTLVIIVSENALHVSLTAIEKP